MAMSAIMPAITRSKELISEKTTQAAIRLVPELSAGKQADRKFFASFVSLVGAIGLLFLLFINTLLAQDAIKLNDLKLEVKMVSDKREAIARTIDEIASPDALANSAVNLGMKPSTTPIFLDLEIIFKLTKTKNE